MSRLGSRRVTSASANRTRSVRLRAATVAIAVAAACAPATINLSIAAEPTAVTLGGVTLRSVAVTVPDSVTEFPGGDAAQVMVQNCSACHSPGMVMTQPPLSESTWREEVNKMINVYKAPVAVEDVPAIVAYLVAHKGAR